jgi:signal transduction histidine kinase/DNA-binding response OmpR family regulator
MRVLIVEDEAPVAEVLSDFLRELGHQALVAKTAETALETIQAETLDAVLLDLHLPSMSGLDLLRLQSSGERHPPIVAMSGVATEGQARECLRLGAVDFLSKPIAFERLAEILVCLKPHAPKAQAACSPGRDRRRAPRVPVSLPVVLPHLRILHTIAEALARNLDVDELLRVALDALTHVTGHEISSLHLLSPDGTTLRLHDDRGLPPGLREIDRELALGEGLIGQVAATGQTMHLAEASQAPELLAAVRRVVREGLRGFVCVPIQRHGRILGTLSLGRRTPEPFHHAEVELLEATADQIALALENARLYAETRHQLGDLKQQLVEEERLSTVGKLAAGLVHEINNPLTVILAQAELLMTKADTRAEDRERLAVIIGETARAAHLLRNLLQLSRRDPPQRQPCSLAEHVRWVLELKGPQLERDDVRVATELGPVPPVWLDENQIRQILLNLVQNAHQAIAGHRGPRVLTIRLGPAPGAVRLEVLDSGPGIRPDALPRIFDAFFTTKPPGEGTGLGLWVSFAIAEQHGGRLRAENRPEGGAAFTLDIPVRERTA